MKIDISGKVICGNFRTCSKDKFSSKHCTLHKRRKTCEVLCTNSVKLMCMRSTTEMLPSIILAILKG